MPDHLKEVGLAFYCCYRGYMPLTKRLRSGSKSASLLQKTAFEWEELGRPDLLTDSHSMIGEASVDVPPEDRPLEPSFFCQQAAAITFNPARPEHLVSLKLPRNQGRPRVYNLPVNLRDMWDLNLDA
jgi:hypothetical protein